jgi:hypothetical protein
MARTRGDEVFKALRKELEHTPLWMLLRHGLKVCGLEFRLFYPKPRSAASAAAEKYELRALPDRKFSGLHLMCLMYAGFKRVAPDQEVQMDLNDPFLTALQMHKNGEEKS